MRRGECLKWYNSVKVKLIGFFLLVSLLFLIAIVSSFSLVRESVIEKSAKQTATLSTAQIVGEIKSTQLKMEESVSILASIMAKQYENRSIDKETVENILYVDNGAYLASGGIWFEPYVLDAHKENNIIFFNRNKEEKFYLVENYIEVNPTNYREMEFYILGKHLKEGEVFWTKVYNDPVTQVSMITVVSPIYEGGTFIGVASLDIEIDHYAKNTKAFNHSYFMIIDRAGTFVSKSSLVEKQSKKENIYEIDDLKLRDVFTVSRETLNDQEEKTEYDPVLANELSQSSPEIDLKDAQRIAGIIQKRENSVSKNIESQIHFIKTDPFLGEKSVLALFYFPDTDWNLIVGITEEEILADTNKMYKIMIIITLLGTLLASVLGFFLLRKYFVSPLEKINKELEESMLEEGHYRFIHCDDKGEIGQLVYNLNFRTLALEDAQRREKDEVQKRLTNEKLLIQQSKMAAMGEMMDAVAHQWKQPLNALSMYSEIIKSDFSDGSVDQKYVDEFKENTQIQIGHMVDTLDEFRSFFRPNKEHEDFIVAKVIESVLFLTKDEFLKHRITVNVEAEKEIELHGSKNEFKHLILNIINNAKDAFNDNNIQEKRMIIIRLLYDEKGKRIEIEDNAGGIPEDVIPDIFKANVTTKEEGKGTGIGLYMSMQIAQKYNATLSVKNQNDGACFTIAFDKEDIELSE